jgi:4-hydroxybenzoate polyprenyltransferase
MTENPKQLDYENATAPVRLTRGRRNYLIALRPHQWLKNFLVFVPLVTSHRIVDADATIRASLAFLAFCLAASAVYLLNDIADLEVDRNHQIKRKRPVASGALSVLQAVGLAAICGVGAIACFAPLPWRFGACLGGYAILASVYTAFLKRKLILDVVCLSALYAGRIFGGAAAIGVDVSAWLLTFAMMMFFSLALAKRYTELNAMRGHETADEKIIGRAYKVSDMPQVATLGTSSGLVSVVVIALYVNSSAVVPLYNDPELLFFICPLVLYWIGRVWMLVTSGRVHEDPIIFAVRDRASWLVLLCVLLLVLAATNISFSG